MVLEPEEDKGGVSFMYLRTITLIKKKKVLRGSAVLGGSCVELSKRLLIKIVPSQDKASTVETCQ